MNKICQWSKSANKLFWAKLSPNGRVVRRKRGSFKEAKAMLEPQWQSSVLPHSMVLHGSLPSALRDIPKVKN